MGISDYVSPCSSADGSSYSWLAECWWKTAAVAAAAVASKEVAPGDSWSPNYNRNRDSGRRLPFDSDSSTEYCYGWLVCGRSFLGFHLTLVDWRWYSFCLVFRRSRWAVALVGSVALVLSCHSIAECVRECNRTGVGWSLRKWLLTLIDCWLSWSPVNCSVSWIYWLREAWLKSTCKG